MAAGDVVDPSERGWLPGTDSGSDLLLARGLATWPGPSSRVPALAPEVAR